MLDNIEFIEMDKKYFDLFFDIMKNSFPKNEMRDYVSQKKLLDNKYYKPLVLKVDDQILAIMATWEFEDFVFIEHLAIHSKLRGQGIGTKLIKNYLSKTKKEIFLEVEPPTCEISKKRILFYEKLGFCLNDFYYLQQPLNPNDSSFELKIMSYSKNISEKEFEKYKKVIYKEVYKVILT